MMTRKDYVKVANILNDIAKPNMSMVPFEDLITEFADMFMADNPNFSPAKFELACLEDKND
jgi:hypothetical protein